MACLDFDLGYVASSYVPMIWIVQDEKEFVMIF